MSNNRNTQLALVLLESLRMINYVGSYGIIGYIAVDLGSTINATQAFLLLPFIAGSMIGQASIGVLSDRVGRRKSLVCFLTIYIAACFASAFCRAPWLFMIMRGCAGLGSTVGEIIVRTIIHENYDIESGAKQYSRISGYSYIVVGLAPFLLNQISSQFGWQSFFMLNAVFGLMVFGIAQSQLRQKTTQIVNRSMTWRQLSVQLFHVARNKQYQINCLQYMLAIILIESGFFLFPVILTDHFSVSKTWLSILYGIITGIVGYLSGLLNTQLLRYFRITRVTNTMLGICCVLAIAYVVNFSLASGTIQYAAYLALFYCSFLCSNIMIINLFMTTTQSINKKDTGAGLMTSLTASVYALSSLIAGTVVSMIETNSPLDISVYYAGYIGMVMLAFHLIRKQQLHRNLRNMTGRQQLQK
ncbi:MAG: hypothetical protein CMF43_00495 [Legionellales bacterium]|nr:hypothetical protein [Legionellales bacterium]